MVASAHTLASQAGAGILREGGNAVDAAVATGLALAVVYPTAGNLGGGGFMLVRLADGREAVIDYRETAPAAATREMYLDANGKPRAGEGSSTIGWRAGGVPGTVAGLALALEKYGSGKITWARAIEPARRLAADGFVVTPGLAGSLQRAAGLLGRYAESKRIYLNDGAGWKPGDLWRQPELAATLARLQREGPREFYEGETARRIASAMEENSGTITRADLAGYRVVEREPLHGRYRGHEILTMPPPSSGGIALLQMLAMFEPFDLAGMGRDSAARHHLFAEVMKRAFRDRAEYLGDPAFVKVPVARLLDPNYLAHRLDGYSADRATPAAEVKPGLGPLAAAVPYERPETTHFSVVDATGNAVSNTYTLNGNYGSGVTITGTGILLNNEMDDFTSAPGVPNMFGLIQSEANAIGPGRRPLSSMTPTLVLKDGKLVLVTGSPGGPTIINTVLQVITNVIDFGLPVDEAVAAPRIHHQWMPDQIVHESGAIDAADLAALQAKGHVLKLREGNQGDAESIALDPISGQARGAADPRSPDAAAVAP